MPNALTSKSISKTDPTSNAQNRLARETLRYENLNLYFMTRGKNAMEFRNSTYVLDRVDHRVDPEPCTHAWFARNSLSCI